MKKQKDTLGGTQRLQPESLESVCLMMDSGLEGKRFERRTGNSERCHSEGYLSEVTPGIPAAVDHLSEPECIFGCLRRMSEMIKWL